MLIFLFEILLFALIMVELIAASLHYYDIATTERLPHERRDYLVAGATNLLATLAAIALFPWTLLARNQRNFDPAGGPPICLVSGSLWGCGSAMFGLYKALRARGARNVYLLPLSFSRGAIDRMGDKLIEELERLSGRTGGHKPYLVAHGVAGLAARMGPCKFPGQYTQGVITIATPHHGTRLAVFIPGQLGFQLQPGSPLLAALEPEPTDCVLTFQSPTDSQIIPAESAGFGKRVRSIHGSGHLSILWSTELCSEILETVAKNPEEEAS